MSYYEQDFGARFAKMGDEAEQAYLTCVNPKAILSGLNRPALDVRKMPLNMRSAPDVTDLTWYAECIGVGRDGIVKIRWEKFEALHAWTCIAPIKIFVWSSAKKAWWLVDLADFEKACHVHGTPDRFPDNNKWFWRLPIEHIPGEPTRVTS
jgi:hypothetical protein